MNTQQIDLSHICDPEKYRADLLNRIGGSVHFDFIVTNFCDRIRQDKNLRQFFCPYKLKDLARFQTDLLQSAFLHLPDGFDLDAHVCFT